MFVKRLAYFVCLLVIPASQNSHQQKVNLVESDFDEIGENKNQQITRSFENGERFAIVRNIIKDQIEQKLG